MLKWFWDNSSPGWNVPDPVTGKKPLHEGGDLFDKEKGPTRPEWVVWLGYASGLRPPKLWAQRDILTWRAFRKLTWERKQKNSKDLRQEREKEEHDDSINDIVVEHKAETEIKVAVIEEVR